MGLVNSDGTPTPSYKSFRNPANEGIVIANAIKVLYKELYDMNEYAHHLSDKALKGLIIQHTGLAEDNQVVSKTIGTFKVLKKIAVFDGKEEEVIVEKLVQDVNENPLMKIPEKSQTTEEGINLSYTINLNLPATTDINVYNAIFKSLREHLL